MHCWAMLNESGMQTYLMTRQELRLNMLLSDISNGNNDNRGDRVTCQTGLDACQAGLHAYGGNQP